jgi:hypothetical protein
MIDHLSEEQLVLYYYGETVEAEVGSHLNSCEACRSSFARLQRTLNVVDGYTAPERGPEYGAEVWRRIEGRIGARRRWSVGWFLAPRQWATAGAMAGLVMVAFLAGRVSVHFQSAAPGKGAATTMASAAEIRQRIVLSAIADHLDRSQILLAELVNTPTLRRAATLDISEEQRRAEELLDANRIYRQAATEAGEGTVADLLDQLERLLLELTHATPKLPAAGVEQLRERIQDDGLLFKVRVMGSEVREREKESTAL